MDEIDTEHTPIESPYALKKVMEKLRIIESYAAESANTSLRTHARLDLLVDSIERLSSRVTALEVSGRWLPYIFSVVALGLSLWNRLLLIHR